jgi:hypothetical protein
MIERALMPASVAMRLNQSIAAYRPCNQSKIQQVLFAVAPLSLVGNSNSTCANVSNLDARYCENPQRGEER